MAIVKMNQFTLLTFDSYKDPLLKELQKFENIQFKDLQKGEEQPEYLKKESFAENVSALESESAKIKFTLDKIKPFVQLPSGMKAFTTPRPALSYAEFDSYVETYDYVSVYEAVKEADEKLKALKTERDRVKAENQNLSNWSKLDVSLKEIDSLKTVKYFVGTINKAVAESFRENIESSFPCSYTELFGAVKDEMTAIIVVPAEDYDEVSTSIKNAGFTRIALNFEDIPNTLITENNARIAKIELSLAGLSESFKQYGSEYQSLQIAYDFFQTALARAKACENFLKTESVLLIEGWVPQELSARFTEILKRVCGNDYYIEETAVDKDSEDVPIKLKNNKVVAAFESITQMYSMPKYNELDPTPVLMPFYWLFFGIMVGDAGYGLLLLIATSVALKKFSLNKGTRNFIQFFFYLSFSIILAGILFGSAFGITVFAPVQTAGGEYKAILDANLDITNMLVLSIYAGVVQIIFGLCVKGYMLIKDGKILDAIFDSFFFIVAVICGVFLVAGFIAKGLVPDSITAVSKWAGLASLIGLALTQGRESPSLGGKIGNGLYSVYGLSGFVGDIVSYTRLVALSLSGAYIASSFNRMAGLMPNPFLKLLAGGLIFLAGQSLNFGLSLLSAYVHSCRLQYVEYFGKFYTGGGKPFKPLQLKNDYIDIQ